MAKCSQCKTTRTKDELKYIQLKPVCTLDVNENCIPKLGLYLVERERKKRDREFRSETRRRKEKLNDTVPEWLKKAQTAFNKFIRVRDSGKPCIACSKPDNGQHQRHASHYRSVGACSALRFNVFNVHGGCATCNSVLSGNLIEMRIGMVERIGEGRVRNLEQENRLTRYKLDYLKRLTRIFNRRAKLYEKWKCADDKRSS